MARSARFFCALFACLFLLAGCKQEREFEGSFEMSAFLQENLRNDPQHEVVFNLLNNQGEAIPYALLRMDWTETGAMMCLQADERGMLTMHFGEDMLDHEIMVSVDIKPEGQIIMETADYSS